MDKLFNIFLVVGLACIIIGFAAKLFVGIMFEIKPISYVIMGNTCLLFAILAKMRKK